MGNVSKPKKRALKNAGGYKKPRKIRKVTAPRTVVMK